MDLKQAFKTFYVKTMVNNNPRLSASIQVTMEVVEMLAQWLRDVTNSIPADTSVE